MAGITKGPATVGRSHVRKETSKLPKDWEVGDPKHTHVMAARRARALRECWQDSLRHMYKDPLSLCPSALAKVLSK